MWRWLSWGIGGIALRGGAIGSVTSVEQRRRRPPEDTRRRHTTTAQGKALARASNTTQARACPNRQYRPHPPHAYASLLLVKEKEKRQENEHIKNRPKINHNLSLVM
jgi:hypothetical protein